MPLLPARHRSPLEGGTIIAEMVAIPGSLSWAKAILAARCKRDTAVLWANRKCGFRSQFLMPRPMRRERGAARSGAEVGNARHRYTESTLAKFGGALVAERPHCCRKSATPA